MGGDVVLYGQLRQGFVGLKQLQEYADMRYRTDKNLAKWTWQILLRDRTYYMLMYPGFSIMGCPYELDVRHQLTGQTREEWAKSADDCFELLSAPEMWAISIESLQSQHHKLYVHDECWHCPDVVNHDNYRYIIPSEYIGNDGSPSKPIGEIDDRRQQVRVHGVNPCVYSLIHWWVVTRLSLSS